MLPRLRSSMWTLLDPEVLGEVSMHDAERFIRKGRPFVEHRNERVFPFLRRSPAELDAVQVVAHGAGVEHDFLAGPIRDWAVPLGEVAHERWNVVLRDLRALVD